MNRLLLISYVYFTLCLLFACAQDVFNNTTVSDPTTSTTVKPILNTRKNRRMARRKALKDIFGTPSSLEINQTSPPFEIPKYILTAAFGPKETPKTSTEDTKEPPDSQNSTDTSGLDIRFITVGMFSYYYHDPENHVNDNIVPENHDDNRKSLTPERRIAIGQTRVQNDTNTVIELKNAANLNVISNLLILFKCFVVLNVFDI